MLPLRTSSGLTAYKCVASPFSSALTKESKDRDLKPRAPPAPRFVLAFFSLALIFSHSSGRHAARHVGAELRGRAHGRRGGLEGGGGGEGEGDDDGLHGFLPALEVKVGWRFASRR